MSDDQPKRPPLRAWTREWADECFVIWRGTINVLEAQMKLLDRAEALEQGAWLLANGPMRAALQMTIDDCKKNIRRLEQYAREHGWDESSD